MTNNSDGLTPTLRPQLGVGWNRALPAPFGFDKGLATAATGYLKIPKFTGKYLDHAITVECWAKIESIYNYSFCGIKFLHPELNAYFNLDARNGGICTTGFNYIEVPTGLAHLVSCFDPINKKLSAIANASPFGFSDTTFSLDFLTLPIIYFLVGSDVSTTEINPFPMDEFRVYKNMMPLHQAISNYNLGFGSNPSETENIIAWYKFESFEMLDFSELQDGSDVKLGIRDLSGNNNHAEPIGLDTNPSSPTYCLKPF